MNEISLINDFVIGRFEVNPLTNTITEVPTFDIDGNKENIYPLVNLDLIEVEALTDVVVSNYKITIVQQRDIKPIKTDSKLLRDNNLIDNLNECNSIALDFVNYLRWKNNPLVIEIQNLSNFTFLKNWKGAGLDGVQFDIELSIYNRGSQDGN
jgi:hypothetical protein